jgi:iron complex outermembrane receptor protein
LNSKSLFILLFLLSFNLIIKGQVDSDSTLTTSLDSIIVSTTRYTIPLVNAPFTISTLENIRPKFPLSLKELLQSTSGIAVNSRSNYSQGDKLLLRGIGTRSAFGVRGIKIFLDGIPLTFPDGQSQLNNLDIQNIDKVEIVKGPSSTLYGNSLGGVVFFKITISVLKYLWGVLDIKDTALALEEISLMGIIPLDPT